MTIGGGDGPISPVGGAGGSAAVEATAGVDGVDHVAEATEVSPTAQAAALAPASATHGTDVIDQITADFDNGRIDRGSAIDALVEAVMPAHVQGASRAEMKALMLELTESDAYLQQLVARLGDKP
ncbi:MAG: hypothetical protein IPL79_01435 [Myxococcales bacterium]|nr:hypothetical protein [Myxococcales bacterium]